MCCLPTKPVVAATILVDSVGIEDTCRVGQLNPEAMDLELHPRKPKHGGSKDSDSDSDADANGKSDMIVLGSPAAVVVKVDVAGSILVLVLQGIRGVDMLDVAGTKCDIVCKHVGVVNVTFIELVIELWPLENPLDATLFVSGSGSSSGANVNDGRTRYGCVEWGHSVGAVSAAVVVVSNPGSCSSGEGGSIESGGGGTANPGLVGHGCSCPYFGWVAVMTTTAVFVSSAVGGLEVIIAASRELVGAAMAGLDSSKRTTKHAAAGYMAGMRKRFTVVGGGYWLFLRRWRIYVDNRTHGEGGVM